MNWQRALLVLTFIALSVPLSRSQAQFNWSNDPNNPRLSDGRYALEPAVLYDVAGERYDLWYYDLSDVKRAVSSDGVNWTTTGNVQSLTSLFSTSMIGCGEVYKVGSTYYMYPGCKGQDGTSWYLGLASSADGNVWTKHPSSPALTKGEAGSWDGTLINGPRVTEKDGIYYMFYGGNGSAGTQIGLATSADGVHWEKYGGNPVMGAKALGPKTSTVGVVGVATVNGLFYMVVSVKDSLDQTTYNMATSSDGRSWSLYEGNPVLRTGSSGTWNAGGMGGGALRYVAGKFRLWYCGCDYNQTWRIGLATSGGSGGTENAFWQQTGGPLAYQDIRSLASNSQAHVFAGAYSGRVYKTTDNGQTWIICGVIPTPNPVLGLVVDQHNHIFASVWTKGIARSTDNGTTWQMKNNGLTNFAVRRSVVDKQGYVWVGTEGGLFRTTDDGETWVMVRSGFYGGAFVDSTGAILTGDGSNSTLLRSTDGGTTWSAKSMNTCVFGAVHSDGSYLGWKEPSQLFRSTDQGTTWTNLNSPVSWAVVRLS